MSQQGDPWVPKSKEEWAEVFALGLSKHQAEQDEKAAKKAAEESSKPTTEGSGNGGDGTPRRRTLGDIILGSV